VHMMLRLGSLRPAMRRTAPSAAAVTCAVLGAGSTRMAIVVAACVACIGVGLGPGCGSRERARHQPATHPAIGKVDAHWAPRWGSAMTSLSKRDGLRGAPAVRSRVTDQAGVLDEASVPQLEQELHAYEAQTCHQFAVVTVASLNGERLEDYSLAFSNQLALGYGGFNNGLLLLIVPTERKARPRRNGRSPHRTLSVRSPT
jgi:hypothetical protein